MATNLVPVGSESQVNTQIANTQLDPDIAVVSDGRFALVFESDTAIGNSDIRLQFVNPVGTLSGTIVDVESEAGDQFNPVVTQFGTGAIVLWQDDAESNSIQFKTVSSAGVVGAEDIVMDSGGGLLSLPDAATLADGRVLAVADIFSTNVDIAFRFISAVGLPSGTARLIEGSTAAGDQTDAAVAASGNQALVVYRDSTVGPSGSIVGRLYDGNGDLATDFSTEVTISGGADATDPNVATLTDGRYIVVWENTDNDDVEARFVDANGTPLGTVFTITNIGGDNEDPRVAALTDGGFVVTWENDGGLFPTEDNSDNDGVVARRFDKDGNPAGDLFLVNAGDPATAQDNPAVAVNRATGEALIAWDDSHVYTAPEDNSPDGVRGRTFQVTTEVVNGTDEDDVISTYSLGEEINGLRGKDRVNAGEGDDVLNGGKQSDSLFGEGGVDTFVFDNKAGKDTLDWEDGEALHFDSSVFKKPNKLGELKKKFFEKGAAADDGNDFFVYLKSKGKLWYDNNADGSGKAKLIAKLDKGSDLDADEIFLI